MFTRKGVVNTPVSDIVKEVGRAQETFYLHFSSKAHSSHAAAEAIDDQLTDSIIHAVNTAAGVALIFWREAHNE